MNPKVIRVVAVDDHNIVLSGIKHELLENEHIEVVATGTRGREVMPLVHEHQPHVLVLDVEMPVGDDVIERFDTIRAIVEIRESYPDTKILAMSHDARKRA